MAMYRRDVLIGTGAVMSAAVFANACGRAKSGPRALDSADAIDPPIVEALRYGITAPSAHNTQPWRIELVSDTEARLFMDRQRLLPATDPPGRQVHMSHGTLLEVTAIAATRFRYRAEIDLLPEGSMTYEEFGRKPTARVRLVEAPKVAVDSLFAELLERRTSRLPHEGPIVTQDELAAIIEHTKPGGLQMALIPEAQLPEALSLVRDAMAIEVNDYELYDETRYWFRFSKRAIREHRDGLSINTAGLTGASAGAANMFLSSKNFHKAKNRERFLKTFGATIDSSRGLLTMTTPSNTMIDWLSTGRAYVRAQLAAQTLGLRFQPVSQILQEYRQMDELRPKLGALVGVEPPAKVQMLVRLGRSATPGLSPRRAIGDFVIEPPGRTS